MVFAGIALVIAIAVAEIVMAARWRPGYVAAGLPIFVRRIDRPRGLDGVSLDDLARSSRTAAAPPLQFRQLDPQTIAFREGGMPYVPLMRGVIRHREGEPSVAVVGFVNWFVVAFVIVLAIGFRRTIIVVLPYLALGLGILYFIQAVRFWRVGTAII
jgi:hypothetical protein